MPWWCGAGVKKRVSLPRLLTVLGIAILPQVEIKTVLYNTLTAPGHPKVRKSFQDSKSVSSEAKFFNYSQTSVV
jgi:hypothetical protein